MELSKETQELLGQVGLTDVGSLLGNTGQENLVDWAQHMIQEKKSMLLGLLGLIDTTRVTILTQVIRELSQYLTVEERLRGVHTHSVEEWHEALTTWYNYEAPLRDFCEGKWDGQTKPTMTPEAFLQDYGMWVAHSYQTGHLLGPAEYMEEFMEAAWMPPRAEVEAFFLKMYGDRTRVDQLLGRFVWDEEEGQ